MFKFQKDRVSARFPSVIQPAFSECNFILMLIIALSSFSTLLIFSRTDAQAQASRANIAYSCDPRCWGTNYWPNQVSGAYSYLYWGSADLNRGDGFVQNTMWLLDEGQPNDCKPLPSDLPSDCYIEAGIRAVAAYNTSNVVSLFWADVRPGYSYAQHLDGGPIDTANATSYVEIQVFKAGTVGWASSWCPIAGSEWCVYLSAGPQGPVIEEISGENHSNTMTTTGYREGMELEGTNGAYAPEMTFLYNQYQDIATNNYYYQANPGDYSKYAYNVPVDSFWNELPAAGNNGGQWSTCITGAGC